MQNEVATLPSNLPVPKEQSVDRSIWSGTRRWRVTVSYKTDVFINDEEKQYFEFQLSQGKKIVKVGEMILTNKFIAITKVI